MSDDIIKFPLPCFSIFFYEISDFVKKIKNNTDFLLKYDVTEDSIAYFSSYFKEDVYNGRSRKILFAPLSNPNITVFATNQTDGANSMVFNLNRFLKCESISLSFSWGGRWLDIYCMEYWKDGESVRFVRSMQDPRWDFYEEGSPLWFEEPELYKQRIIKKRMNKEILIKYCNKLGFKVEDVRFWKNFGQTYELEFCKKSRL